MRMLSVPGTNRQSSTRDSPPLRWIIVGCASLCAEASDAVNSRASRAPRADGGIRVGVADEIASIGALQVGDRAVAGEGSSRSLPPSRSVTTRCDFCRRRAST
jgi:hypothetical protein